MEKIILEVPEDKIDRLKKALDELKIDYKQENINQPVKPYKELLTKISTWNESDITEIEQSKVNLGKSPKEKW